MTFRLDQQVAESLAAHVTDRLPVGDVAGRRQRLRASMAGYSGRAAGNHVAVRTELALRPGGGTVTLRIYRPTQTVDRSVVLYFHGGGLISGSADMFDAVVSDYAGATRRVFVSVDYRLAPEHPLPAAQHDAWAALEWVHANAVDARWDADRVAVMGDSSGGFLAASLCLMALSHPHLMPACQILVYPMLDDDTANATGGPEEPFLTWTHDDDQTAWRAAVGSGHTPSRAGLIIPARAPALAGLCPAYLEVGDLDLYRTATVHYAERLCAAGVNTDLVVRAGVPHEFDVIAPNAQVSRRARADRASVVASV